MHGRWSTRYIAPRHRTEFWRSVGQEAGTPITPRIPVPEAFEASLDCRDFEGVLLNRVQVRSTRHDVEQTLDDARRNASCCLLVDLYLGGEAHCAQGSAGVAVRPGLPVLLDGRRTYALRHPGAVEMLALAVPHAMLGNIGKDIGALCARPLPATASLQLLASQMRFLADWAEPLREAESIRLGEQLAATLQAVLFDFLEDDAEATRERRFLWRKVRQLIARQYADPAFGAAVVADQLGMSVRTMQARLAQEGSSFLAELSAYRLKRAHTILLAARGCAAIAEVSKRCGFASPAHFSRAFHARYGMAPSALRHIE